MGGVAAMFKTILTSKYLGVFRAVSFPLRHHEDCSAVCSCKCNRAPFEVAFRGLVERSGELLVVPGRSARIDLPSDVHTDVEARESNREEIDPIKQLLQMSLDDVLETYPAFREAFKRGNPDMQESWRRQWPWDCPEIRLKLLGAYKKGLFSFKG